MRLKLISLLLLSSLLQAQGIFSSTARRVVKGASLPATCDVGAVYFKTAATVGLYQCSVADTWVIMSGVASPSFTGTSTFTGDVYAQTLLVLSTTTLDSDITSPGGSIVSVGNSASSASGFTSVTNTTWGSPPIFLGLFTRATGTSTNANTVVQSGDALMRLQAMGADGVVYRQAAAVSFEVDGTPGSSDMPGRIVFLTSPDGSATPTEKMRVTNAGKVLIIDLKTTGAATGKTVVCVDTSTGQLYASSSGVACAN